MLVVHFWKTYLLLQISDQRVANESSEQAIQLTKRMRSVCVCVCVCACVCVQVVVVGNPANTNAMICSHFASSIPKENFTALTRLDHNRAKAQVCVCLSLSLCVCVSVCLCVYIYCVCVCTVCVCGNAYCVSEKE